MSELHNKRMKLTSGEGGAMARARIRAPLRAAS